MPILVVVCSHTRGRMEWFSTVFAHEFAHVVSLKAYRATAEPTFTTAVGGLYQNGINRPITKDSDGNKTAFNNVGIGFEFPFADSDSVWWVEGGAEFGLLLPTLTGGQLLVTEPFVYR